MPTLLAACAVCTNGMTRLAFPPAGLWAIIAVAWLLAISWLSPRIDPSGRLAPRIGTAVIILIVLTIPAAHSLGFGVYLLLLPLCLFYTGRFLLSHKHKVVLRLLVLVVVALASSAAIQYFRVSRMTPVERVERVRASPAVGVEVARLAREADDPHEMFAAILAASDSRFVVNAVGREIRCTRGDLRCARLLADLLDKSVVRKSELQSALRQTSGLQMPETASAGEWRIALQALQESGRFAFDLVDAAIERLSHVVVYDGGYRRIDYPMGDVPDDIGVCTDVVIRSYRAVGIDLQQQVHEDMTASFAEYPDLWGHTRPDPNIDHRRVPNLQVFFERHGASLAKSRNPDEYLPGDLVTWMLPGNLPHMGVVTDRRSVNGKRPLIVHNVGSGPELEDMLFVYPITGHYRYGPPGESEE